MSDRRSPAAGVDHWVIVGGSGFVGTAVVCALVQRGAQVTVVDRHRPRARVPAGVRWLEVDLLVDEVDLPPGRIVVLSGNSEPAPPWRWTIPLENSVSTARLTPALEGRDVVLASSVEAYGAAPAPLTEASPSVFPLPLAELRAWTYRVADLAATGPCPPWRAAPMCRELVESDVTGRWVYGMAKWVQEQLLLSAGAASATVLRLGNLFGPGQERVVAEMARAARTGRAIVVTRPGTRSLVALDDAVEALVNPLPGGIWNVGGTPIMLEELARVVQQSAGSCAPLVYVPPPQVDSAGVVDSGAYVRAGGCFRPLLPALEAFVQSLDDQDGPLFEPAMPVVIPPRPARPDEVVERQAAVQWNGRLKAGQQWSTELATRLRPLLGLDAGPGEDREVLATVSGTAGLRLAVAAVAGPARPGDVAVLPSFTFPATAEVLVQLGYALRFADVDLHTWTLDPTDVAAAVNDGQVRVVVGVDTFGNALDYDGLAEVCRATGAAFVADSAAAVGSRYHGYPIGTQADAHAFSFSFAKSFVAGGAGGAVVLPVDRCGDRGAGWDRSQLMAELHAIAAVDQLAVIDELILRRRRLTEHYRALLARTDGVVVQRATVGSDVTFAHFVLRCVNVDRDGMGRCLDRLGIGSKPYFPALHRTSHTAHHARHPRPLPVTDLLHEQAIALPLSSEMTRRDVGQIVVGLERAMASMDQG